MWWQEHEVEVAMPYTVRKHSEINIPLFSQPSMPTHEVMLPAFRVGLSSAMKLTKIIPHRHAQGFVSWVIQNATKLTINTNYHMESSSKKHALQLIIMGKTQMVLELFTGKWEDSGSNPTSAVKSGAGTWPVCASISLSENHE